MFNNQITATKLLNFDTLLTILSNMLSPPANEVMMKYVTYRLQSELSHCNVILLYS